jgi:cyclohexadieny/prephenate dehydrogenase / 3-phosphoshikimate 1-carboxyvinyltransferase
MSDSEINYIIMPGGKVQGELSMPGDKSIAQRAIIFATISDGISTLSGMQVGQDCISTLNACVELGAKEKWLDHSTCQITGTAETGLQIPNKPLYLGNSGTGMRLLSGVVAGNPIVATLTGDESLSKRPMKRIIQPLVQMGADIASFDNHPPLIICGGSPLHGINYDMPIASSQVKSCIVFASLFAEGTTSISQPSTSRDHTERMLQALAYPHAINKNILTIQGRAPIKAYNWHIPGDISSAAFFMVAASITPGADLLIKGVGINPTRRSIIDILQLMGANIEISNEREYGCEPVADIRIRYAPLTGIKIAEEHIVSAMDEFPCCCIAAACADGITEFRHATELRVKESDRIKSMVVGLQTLGIAVDEFEDGVAITGGEMSGGRINSFHDHRVAMAFAIAALRSKKAIFIQDCDNVGTSYPDFVTHAQQVGIYISQTNQQEIP